jgi:hypothetical protein
MKPTAQTPIELYDLKADEITAHILGYLRAKGFVAWAQDNRGRYNPRTGKWYPHPNNRVGVPDIIGYRKSDARFIGVEVKAGKDRLSDYQIDFLNELKEHGGLPTTSPASWHRSSGAACTSHHSSIKPMTPPAPIRKLTQNRSGFWVYRPNKYNTWAMPSKAELVALILKSCTK